MKHVVALSLVFFIAFANILWADIALPSIISSNMVLQRNTTVKLWGWADPMENILFKGSWMCGSIKTKADKDGKWLLEVETNDEREAQTLTFKGKNKIVLNNVLFGEVWICSGQSNMEMPLEAYDGQPVFEGQEAILKAQNPNLRLFNVPKRGSDKPLDEFHKKTTWELDSPESAAKFSAVGYFFGSQLQARIGVPVGLIFTAYGGSHVCTWMSAELISSYKEISFDYWDYKKPHRVPSALYNAMINPLIPYTIKGAIWYQGESDKLASEQYKTLFPDMVKEWRAKFDVGDFPFYFTQIAPFDYNIWGPTLTSAYIREAQQDCVDLIPNSEIAITMDLGEEKGIHPARKKEVGTRLMLHALVNNYGYKGINNRSPRYEAYEVKDEGILLKFKDAPKGLYTYNNLNDFEIAGDDKVFYPAEAKIINNNQVFVKSNAVKNPVAVRYAWKHWVEGSLFGVNLLPISSFRTDDWDEELDMK